MSLQISLALRGDLTGYAQATHLRLARGARNAAERLAGAAKARLRPETRAALGDRVANTWRADVYPKSPTVRTHAPAVLVYSKAPKIVTAFGEATTIVAKNAKFLAIPTANTPRRGRRHATPVEVEAMFNQDLIFIKGLGRRILAFVNAVEAKNKRGFRKASPARLAKGRKVKLVLMFVMVPQVGLKQRLNWRAAFADLKADWAKIFPEEINRALSAGSN